MRYRWRASAFKDRTLRGKGWHWRFVWWPVRLDDEYVAWLEWRECRVVDTEYTVFKSIINTVTEQTVSFEEPVGFNLSPTDVFYFVADTDTNGASINLRFSLVEYERT